MSWDGSPAWERSACGRYEQDPHFRTLVDTLYSCIDRADFTPTEIRQAAMLAQIMYEARHPQPILLRRSSVCPDFYDRMSE